MEAIIHKYKDEILALANEKANLLQEIDLIKPKLKEATESLISTKERTDEIVRKVKDLVEVVGNTRELAREAVRDEIKMLHSASMLIDEYNRELESLWEKMGATQKDIELLKDSLIEEHKQIVKEWDELDTKKKDLDVYKKRLEVKYPEEKIIV